MVDVEVKPHVRRIRRTRDVRTCPGPDLPKILPAPGPHKLIPKGTDGPSVWIHTLLEKFLPYRPISRRVGSLRLLGVTLSPGTIPGGLNRLAPLFDPVYQAIIRHNQQATHWHAAETRWLVFEEVQGKVG